MAPNRRKGYTSTDTWPHVLNFDLRVFRSCHRLARLLMVWVASGCIRKYRSVCPGSTSAFALMPFMAASKSPLYGSWAEQSPACQVYSIVSIFSGSEWISKVFEVPSKLPTFRQSPGFPEIDHEVFETFEAQRRCSLVQFLAIEGLAETPTSIPEYVSARYQSGRAFERLTHGRGL